MAAAAFLLSPITGFAAYVIHLKDGTQFVTDQYYEEGNQIRFKRYGGLVGIEKDRIREIEEIEAPTAPPEKKETPAETAAPPAAAEADKQRGPEQGTPRPDIPKQGRGKGTEKDQEKPGQLTEEQKKGAEKTKAEKIAAFLEEKRRLDAEIKRVYSEFNEAKTNADKDAQKEHFKKLKSLREKLTELQENVKAAYGGKFPDWWTEAR